MDASAWVGAAGAAIAVVALYFTWKQAQSAQAQTLLQRKVMEDAAQPYIWADIRPDARAMHLMKLVVRNEGPTVATDVLIAFDPPLPRVAGEQTYSEFIVTGMPPGRHMEWHLNTSPDWLQGSLPKRFRVRVSATGPHGPIATSAYEIDVEDYRQAAATPPGTLHGVTEAIKGLGKALDKR